MEERSTVVYHELGRAIVGRFWSMQVNVVILIFKTNHPIHQHAPHFHLKVDKSLFSMSKVYFILSGRFYKTPSLSNTKALLVPRVTCLTLVAMTSALQSILKGAPQLDAESEIDLCIEL